MDKININNDLLDLYVKKSDYTELETELKRLKSENEELQGKYNGLNANYNSLKFENERLKEEINKLGKKHEDYCNTMYWQMKEQMDKYRSALQEIREICKNSHTSASEDFYRTADKIQDKINEVIGAE